MEFHTLHELSVQYDISVRVLRRRLKQLLAEGKLIENEHCRREGYVDETHFTWLVNADAFINAAALRPVSRTNDLVATPAAQPAAPASRSVITTHPPNYSPAANPTETLPKVDSAGVPIEREMIDLLKEQMRVKDGQITDLHEQNKSLNDLHLKLTGQIVNQTDQIKNLMRLTGGKIDMSELARDSNASPKDERTPAPEVPNRAA